MLDEEKTKNPVPFSSKAVLLFFLPRIITPIIVFAVIFFFLGILMLLANVILLMIAVLVLLLVTLLFLHWYSREYFKRFLIELRTEYIFSRKGVIVPSYTMIPYKNIQDVHLEQPILEKSLGLCNVLIYTATVSSRGSERIPLLNLKDAETFKEMLFSRIKEVRKVVD